MKKLMIIYGHGGNDPGAGANGINERDFYRQTLHPFLWKWAERSERLVEFVTENAFQTRLLDRVDASAYDVVELHLDAASSAATGGHVIIHSDYTADVQDKRLASLIQRFFGCRGNKCVDGRADLQNVNIARARGINYRLIELCFVTNPSDVKKLMNNLDGIAKGIIEAMTGETLTAPVVKPEPKPQPKPEPTPPPSSGGEPDEWSTKVKKDLVGAGVMSDANWDKALTKMELASILYTAKQRRYFK